MRAQRFDLDLRLAVRVLCEVEKRLQVAHLRPQFRDLFVEQGDLPLAFGGEGFFCGKFFIRHGQQGGLPFSFGGLRAKIVLQGRQFGGERFVFVHERAAQSIQFRLRGAGGGKQCQRIFRLLPLAFQIKRHRREFGIGVRKPRAQRLCRGRAGDLFRLKRGDTFRLRIVFGFKLSDQRLQRLAAGGGKAGGLCTFVDLGARLRQCQIERLLLGQQLFLRRLQPGDIVQRRAAFAQQPGNLRFELRDLALRLCQGLILRLAHRDQRGNPACLPRYFRIGRVQIGGQGGIRVAFQAQRRGQGGDFIAERVQF